jgi:2-octaprenyl-6-methoxyphenol hydroxylase
MVLDQHSAQVLSADAQRPVEPLVVDVAIVGGGIVGLTLACALQQSGLQVAVIEVQPRDVGIQRRRAYHITLLSGRIFQGLGIWQEVLPQITTFQQIRLAEEHYPAVVDLRPEDLGTEALGYVAEHGVLLKALQDRLAAASHITWLCPAELVKAAYQTDQVILTVNQSGQQRHLTSRLLVAADGARSPLRQRAGIGTHGWQYWQSCITTVIRPEKPHRNIAREHFWRSGPFATLPLPDNRAQIVLTAPHGEAQDLLAMPEARFLAELEYRYQGQLGRIALESDRLLFPVQLMHSDRYIQHRLALVGDAAHCCHPVGGQGMNLGIRDAAILAEVLQAAHQRGEDIGSLSVLRRYEGDRRPGNLTILGFTDLLDRLFSNSWWPLMMVRRGGLWLLRGGRPLRYLALRLMTGLTGKVPALAQPSTGRNQTTCNRQPTG